MPAVSLQEDVGIRAIACKPRHASCLYLAPYLSCWKPGDSGGWSAPPSIRFSEAIRHAPDGPQT